jgi:hypothetical protein
LATELTPMASDFNGCSPYFDSPGPLPFRRYHQAIKTSSLPICEYDLRIPFC